MYIWLNQRRNIQSSQSSQHQRNRFHVFDIWNRFVPGKWIGSIEKRYLSIQWAVGCTNHRKFIKEGVRFRGNIAFINNNLHMSIEYRDVLLRRSSSLEIWIHVKIWKIHSFQYQIPREIYELLNLLQLQFRDPRL